MNTPKPLAAVLLALAVAASGGSVAAAPAASTADADTTGVTLQQVEANELQLENTTLENVTIHRLTVGDLRSGADVSDGGQGLAEGQPAHVVIENVSFDRRPATDRSVHFFDPRSGTPAVWLAWGVVVLPGGPVSSRVAPATLGGGRVDSLAVVADSLPGSDVAVRTRQSSSHSRRRGDGESGWNWPYGQLCGPEGPQILMLL
jgi:hypothetical protein